MLFQSFCPSRRESPEPSQPAVAPALMFAATAVVSYTGVLPPWEKLRFQLMPSMPFGKVIGETRLHAFGPYTIWSADGKNGFMARRLGSVPSLFLSNRLFLSRIPPVVLGSRDRE